MLTSACSTPSPEAGATAGTGAVAVVALAQRAPGPALPGTTVDVTVPRAAAQVRLDLSGVSQPADELTAELEAVASGDVRRWPVDAATGGVSVTVPIYAVPAGEHALTLWQGDADVVARYRFRVVVR
jgi:hypothetical protein